LGSASPSSPRPSPDPAACRGDRFEAIVDLKTDRAARRLVVQSWHWLGNASKSLRLRIEDELHRFETFQLAAE
jgi:hypothetical protein